MKKIVIIIIIALVAFYIFKPLPDIHPQYVAVFRETVGSCYIIPPPLDEDGPSMPLFIHYKGEVYGTVNLIRETKDEYYIQDVHLISKRIGYDWVPKRIIKLERIDGR